MFLNRVNGKTYLAVVLIALSVINGCGKDDDTGSHNKVRAQAVWSALCKVAEESGGGWMSHELEFGPGDLPVIRKALTDTNPRLRWSACGALAKMSPLSLHFITSNLVEIAITEESLEQRRKRRQLKLCDYTEALQDILWRVRERP